jgi:hypothetical protein
MNERCCERYLVRRLKVSLVPANRVRQFARAAGQQQVLLVRLQSDLEHEHADGRSEHHKRCESDNCATQYGTRLPIHQFAIGRGY